MFSVSRAESTWEITNCKPKWTLEEKKKKKKEKKKLPEAFLDEFEISRGQLSEGKLLMYWIWKPVSNDVTQKRHEI